MKKYVFIVCLTFFMILTGCSKDDQLPNKRLDQYINLWNKSDFTEMYKMLSDDNQDTYAKEDFIDSYEKIYQDLEIENLELSYTELTEEEEKEALESSTATYTLNVAMD